jgi:hypothetical protein
MDSCCQDTEIGGIPLKRFVLIIALLLISSPVLAQSGHGWRSYPLVQASGQRFVQAMSKDGAGGLWLGYVSGGRGIYAPGGLVHMFSDGNSVQLTQDVLKRCPSVDALALADDNTLWLRLAGRYDYGANNHGGSCDVGVQSSDTRFMQSLGYMTSSGEIKILSSAEMPNLSPGAMNYENKTLVTDVHSRPWIGAQNGVAVRNGDGSWQHFTLWTAQTTTLEIGQDQRTIIAAANNGEVATIAPDGRVSKLPSLPSSAYYLAMDNNTIWASINEGVYQLSDSGWNKIVDTSLVQPIIAKDSKLWVGASDGLTLYQPNAAPLRYTHQNSYVPYSNIITFTWLSNDVLAIGGYLGISTLNVTQNTFVDASREILATERLWQNTNRNAAGTWVWGPTRWAEQYEPYHEAPNGARYVVYYDKTRMEVTQPDGDSSSQWYITNGLLVQEMVSGFAQFSDNSRANTCPSWVHNNQPCSAMQKVVGDPEQNPAPSYSHFADYLGASRSRVGQRVSQAMVFAPDNYHYQIVEQAERATPETTIAYFDSTTEHNIPRVLFDYMQQQPQDWLYMFGHPITEPYWTQASVGGQTKWVLVQLFERRSLSYTPDNPAEWRVEMGNVGQHYYAWRYGQNPWDK